MNIDKFKLVQMLKEDFKNNTNKDFTVHFTNKCFFKYIKDLEIDDESGFIKFKSFDSCVVMAANNFVGYEYS